MTPLEELIKEMEFTTIPFVTEHQTAKQRWLDEQNALFTRVCENKPATPPALHLLGLLTKSHIEASALYEQHAHTTHQMQIALSESVGDEHASKFTNQSAEDLILITHLWLYTQGYLNMDFSLAHDHAQQTQTTLQHELVIKRIDVDAFRTELMRSFYLGRNANPIKSGGLLGWLKRLLSR
jgi:hypothetical protein